jgi:hypothetical protein
MGRNITADNTPLLKNAEQNIGNSAIVAPQPYSFPVLVTDFNPGTVIPQPTPGITPRLIDLSGGSAVGQSTSIIMTASRILQGAQNPYPGFAGPITGVIEFGSGGRSTKVEFDVPVGPYAGSLAKASSAIEPQDGGIIITVPTSVLRVYARYDNLLVANMLGTVPMSVAQSHSQNVLGPGGPLLNDPTDYSKGFIPAEPVLVKAMAAYFTRHFSRAYRTVWCYIGGQPISLLSPVHAFALPAFAQTVQVFRTPKTAQLDITLQSNTQFTREFTIPGGSLSPVVELTGQETIINIGSPNNLPANKITTLAFSCEVGV